MMEESLNEDIDSDIMSCGNQDNEYDEFSAISNPQHIEPFQQL